MVRDPLTRTLSRLTILLTAVLLVIGAGRGVFAAPASQDMALINEIRRQVSEIRGLETLEETPIVPIPRPDLVGRLSKSLNEQQTVREFLTSQMLLEVLGAMQKGFDLRQLQLDLLAEQTLAVYDFDERVVFLVGEEADALSTDGRLIIAHELTHALQDQHFSLRRVLPLKPQNSDADIAARALVEGDAMLAMRTWGRQYLRPIDKRSLGDGDDQDDPVLDKAPPLVQGELLFPYDAGWVFAQLLYQDGGYEAVNNAFVNLPRSSEHILHPEKYLAGEAPLSVTIAPLEDDLGGTWKTLRTDVFGELVLRLLLEPHIGWPEAEAAAAGWGGDAYTILEDGDGRRIVGMVTVWDTEADAAQMYNAFVASISSQFRAAQSRTILQPSLGRWTTPDYQVQAIKTDNVVRIVYAPDEQTLDAVEAQLSAATVEAAPQTAPAAPRPAPAAPRPAPSPAAVPSPELQDTPPAFQPSSEPASAPQPTAPADDLDAPVAPTPQTPATVDEGVPLDDAPPPDEVAPGDAAPGDDAVPPPSPDEGEPGDDAPPGDEEP